MDSHEWNKIIGSVLGTVLFILVVRAVGEAIGDGGLERGGEIGPVALA